MIGRPVLLLCVLLLVGLFGCFRCLLMLLLCGLMLGFGPMRLIICRSSGLILGCLGCSMLVGTKGPVSGWLLGPGL